MNFSVSYKKNKAGFTLVEAMIFSFIFAIVTVSFYRTFVGGAKVLRDSKARIAAAQLANEKFEILRNVSYEDLTTDPDRADGHVPFLEEATRSNIKFNVETSITDVDDNYDGEFILGTDEKSSDYKQVEVAVSWGAGEDKRIRMITHIAPPGTEELYTGGILNIEVRQSDGTPVGNAQVSVVDISNNEAIVNSPTSADGKKYIIGLEPRDKQYRISVSKAGYESVVTMPPYNQTAYDPVDEHGSVVLAGIWSQTIIFDPLATVNIKTQDPLGNAIGNIDFSLEGGRKLGDTVPDALPVFSYAKTNRQTDATGTLSFAEKSPGRYNFEYPDPATANNIDYEFWKLDPFYGGNKMNFFANPGSTSDVAVLLLPKNTPSLFLRVVDQADGTPLSGVSVNVKNESLLYDETLETDQFGQVYFPFKDGETVVPLENEQYDVSVQAQGYQDEQTVITVSNLTKQDIQIHP